MTNKKRKILFAGSGYFAIPQIKALKKVYNLEVITQKSDTPVKKELKGIKGIKIYEVQDSKELEKILEKIKPSVLIVSDFGIILSEKALKIPSLVLNTHPSLLPRYRGPSPYISAILNGEEKTGVSLIKMTKKIDGGPIYLKIETKIEKKETSSSLRKKLGELAAKILLIKLEKIILGKLKPTPQNEKEATYTKLFKKEDGLINWEEKAEIIERKIRAFDIWPQTFTFFELENGKKIRVKIKEVEIESGNTLKPKSIKIEKEKIKIKTGKDYIVIKKIQPEGKKEMPASDFLRGYKIKKIFTPR